MWSRTSQCTRRAVALGLPVLVAGSIAWTPTPALGANLWYSGDFDGNDASSNQNYVPINVGGSYSLDSRLVFDNFIVPVGQTWTITSMYTNDQVSYFAAPTKALWQIRSGVSAGNGGTLVASGDTTATVTAGHAVDYNNYLYPEYKVAASVPSITLSAGTYWMAVAPDSAGFYGDQSYIETTSGANAIGAPAGNAAAAFVLDTGGTDPANFAAADYPDYSAGVVGIDAAPEPTTALLLGGAMVPALVGRRRRRH